MWLTRTDGVWKWRGQTVDTLALWHDDKPKSDKKDKDCASIKHDKIDEWEKKKCDDKGLSLCEGPMTGELLRRCHGMTRKISDKYS